MIWWHHMTMLTMMSNINQTLRRPSQLYRNQYWMLSDPFLPLLWQFWWFFYHFGQIFIFLLPPPSITVRRNFAKKNEKGGEISRVPYSVCRVLPYTVWYNCGTHGRASSFLWWWKDLFTMKIINVTTMVFQWQNVVLSPRSGLQPDLRVNRGVLPLPWGSC